MAVCDAHAHPGTREEQDLRLQQGVRTLLCASDPDSAELVSRICAGNDILIPTYGLHPWYADRFEVDQMLPYMKQGRLLGEIGLDRVWCEVPLERQRSVFKEQLALAEHLDMPVILHTKGAEKEILECIASFGPPVLVHWYSAEEYLDGYVEKDCFFSVGPDVLCNPAVQKVAARVRPERLLVETDGMEAARWAAREYGQADVGDEELTGVLRRAMDYIAMVKGLDAAAVEAQLEANFLWLTGYAK